MAKAKTMAEVTVAMMAETTWRQRQWLWQKRRLWRQCGCNVRATMIVEARVDVMVEARGGWGNRGKGKDGRGNSRGRSKGRGHSYGGELEAKVVATIAYATDKVDVRMVQGTRQ